LNQQHDPTERELKEGAERELEFIFHATLSRLIARKYGIDVSLIWSYKLSELDESTRNDFIAKVKAAMATPRETGTYQLVMEVGSNPDDAHASKFVLLEGLLVLGILGDKSVIPSLLAYIKDEPQATRTNIVIAALMRYLTGQDISGYILSDEDIARWEAWWQETNNASPL
jgi:hypothetical protein